MTNNKNKEMMNCVLVNVIMTAVCILVIFLGILIGTRVMSVIERESLERVITEDMENDPEVDLIVCDLDKGLLIYKSDGMIYEYSNYTISTMYTENYEVKIYNESQIMEAMIDWDVN